jgi:hypothetical protein
MSIAGSEFPNSGVKFFTLPQGAIRRGMNMSTIRPQTATLANVASSITVVTLIAAGTGRNGRIIYNDSTAILYVAFGSGASTSNYTVQVPSQGTYDLGNNGAGMYGGLVTGIWASANGNARVTTW